MTDIWNLNSLCRCCHTDGNFNDLNSFCNIMGSLEMYSDLLRDTFDVHLYSPPIDVSNTICDKCINHLRDGVAFKKKVLECELKFQEYCRNELLQHVNIKLEKDDEDNGLIVNSEMILKDIDNNVLSKSKITLKDKDNNCYCETEETKSTIYDEPQENEQEEIKTNKVHCGSEIKTKRTRVRLKDTADRYLCKLCEINFTNIKSFRKHNTDKHNSTYTCNICDIKFKTPKSHEKHMYYHSICVEPTIPLAKITKFDCKMCTKSYRTINQLREHRNTHTRENIYTCDLCKKEFLYKSTLTKHILWHTGRNKQYMCDACGNSFNDVTNLNKHIITVHKKLKLFKCTLCTKEFAANKTLKVHMRLHTGERPYKCDSCNKTFACTENLNDHQRKHEIKKKIGGIYICKICNSAFDHRGIYTTHLRSHITSREYKCTECNDNFSNSFSLKRHMETHITVKKYTCDKCCRKFPTKSKLQIHGRYHDPNRIRNVKTERINCELCKKYVTDIEKHMKTHYNRRHQCEFCDKVYPERNALNRHVKHFHDGVRHECDLCEKKFVNITSLKTHKMKLHNLKLKTTEEE